MVVRNGRTYHQDPLVGYPLPIDLQELHRQSLMALMLIQVYGSPLLSLDELDRPPTRILDVGCGSGFYSMMCHRYLKSRGIPASSVTHVGLDIAPVAPGPLGGSAQPDPDMNWKFVQHDLRQFPWPFENGEFDVVHIVDMALACPTELNQQLFDEYIRILRPGGFLEIWHVDYTIRMLRPHVPTAAPSTIGSVTGPAPTPTTPSVCPGIFAAPTTTGTKASTQDTSEDRLQQTGSIPPMGVYDIHANTPLSAPLNPFLVEYNSWVMRGCESRHLTPLPCTMTSALYLQETGLLVNTKARRVAIPLSEVRWEREGVGGIVTKDGKSYVDWRGKTKEPPSGGGAGGESSIGGVSGDASANCGSNGPGNNANKGGLTSAHLAIRRTALLTVVQQIQNLEPMLREVSGKNQDEWDAWVGKLTNDLLCQGGTSWGECLETGAWLSRKL